MWLKISLDLGVGSLKPKYTDSGRFGHALWHSPGTWCIEQPKQNSLTQAKRVRCDLSPSFFVAWPLEGDCNPNADSLVHRHSHVHGHFHSIRNDDSIGHPKP